MANTPLTPLKRGVLFPPFSKGDKGGFKNFLAELPDYLFNFNDPSKSAQIRVLFFNGYKLKQFLGDLRCEK